MDRIKLAEAMGWKRTSIELVDAGQARGWESPDKTLFRTTDKLPDPENDANDDYAVLEHFRSSGKADRFEFYLCMALNDDPVRYTIGHYARAALKVIDRALSEVRTEDAA